MLKFEKERRVGFVNERIRKLRRTLDLTQAVFAEKIGMKQNSIALVEGGKRNISDYAIRVICREFDVNEEWLRTGNGEMFNPSPDSELDALAKKYGLSHNARVMIEKFINLKPDQQDAVIHYIKEVASSLDDSGTALSPVDISAAEAAYEKSLGIVPKEESIVLNTTSGAENKKNA